LRHFGPYGHLPAIANCKLIGRPTIEVQRRTRAPEDPTARGMVERRNGEMLQMARQVRLCPAAPKHPSPPAIPSR